MNKIFVAAWYYPPINTSEAIVTYKLLKNSKYSYDVLSCLNKSWCYDDKFSESSDRNIKHWLIKSKNFKNWKKRVIKAFADLHEKENYSFVMTRSMPEESVTIGIDLKKLYPNIKWIASLADPIGNNPYYLKTYFENDSSLSKELKEYIKYVLRSEDVNLLKKISKKTNIYLVKKMCHLRIIELETLKYADLIISPSEDQLRYINNSWLDKYFVVPHSYDENFYTKISSLRTNNKIIFTYIGLSDDLRSLMPFVKAIKILKEKNSKCLHKIFVQFVGSIENAVKLFINKERLTQYVRVLPSVEYLKSLQIMEESDWLIHVDAFFNEINKGGSIFFAGKLADYIGAKKPIIGITGKNTPAFNIIMESGGIVVDKNPEKIANILEIIIKTKSFPKTSNVSLFKYNAKNVAKKLDNKLNSIKNKDRNIKENNKILFNNQLEVMQSLNNLLVKNTNSQNSNHKMDINQLANNIAQHYFLYLQYSKNLKNNLIEIVDFDDKLKSKSLHLYNEVGKNLIIACIRKHNWSCLYTKKLIFIKAPITFKLIIRKLLINSFTIKIYKSNFFNKGICKKIKSKVRLSLNKAN